MNKDYRDKYYGIMKCIGRVDNNLLVYAKVIKQYDNRVVLDYSKIRILDGSKPDIPMHIVDRLK